MTRTHASSANARIALELVEELQRRFVEKLEAVTRAVAEPERFDPISWLRDGGRHGGGVRYVAVETPVFNRAAVNVSQVHYDDDPGKKLSSATAISTIIHPRNARAPSYHMHISWTEMRDGGGYWRLMADLNPAIEDPAATALFEATLREAATDRYDEGSAQGDRYFNIPALGRHRGVSHFYLEGYSTGNLEVDAGFARSFGEAMIDRYAGLLQSALVANPEPTDGDRAAQLAYHSLYLLQVLTLDRGTTSGLLVHNQNDVGILGSLPAYVDRPLLSSWISKLPSPQDGLLRAIVDTLPDEHPAHVTEETRQRLADVVRTHYRENPEALAMQASGNTIPPTVDNHQASS